MAIVPVGILDVVDPSPEELAICQAALDAVDPAFPLVELLGNQRQRVTFHDSLGALGGSAEGFYPRFGRVKITRMKGRKGQLKAYRMEGTLLHELGHGFHLTEDQKDAFVALLGGDSWKGGNYWDHVNEAVPDHCVRLMTNGEIVSHYEEDRLPIPDGKEPDFEAILFSEIGVAPPPVGEENPEPMPNAELNDALNRIFVLENKVTAAQAALA